MKLLILPYAQFSLWSAPPWFGQRLRKDFPQIDVVHISDFEEIEGQIENAEIAVGWSLRAHQFAAATKLKWIHSPAAGVHQLLFPELVNSDVMLTNGRDVHGASVAEHAIALIFALAKKLPLSMRLQHRRAWGQDQVWKSHPPPREVSGATLGLVGIGSIGLQVAKRASALGMRVIAVRENIGKDKPENVDQVFSFAEVESMLRQSDYVVIAAPLTPTTRSMMNSRTLAVMKPEAYLINVSRGALLDEAALIHALRSNKIAGAALDVFDKEPLAPESPLWDLDNVLITPHTAGLNEKMWERQYLLFAENLQRYLDREPLIATVDKAKGY